MPRPNSLNPSGLRAALIAGSVVASVLGARLVTQRDAAKQQDTSGTPDTPQPTPTPKIIVVYDLPPVPTAVSAGGGQAAVSSVSPQSAFVNVGGGGGGGGGGHSGSAGSGGGGGGAAHHSKSS